MMQQIERKKQKKLDTKKKL
jgi:hypothetical protein